MAHMHWSDDLNTGIDVIDRQHQRIVDYINELHHAIEHGDRDEVGHVIEQLIDYTYSHFTFEEELMEEAEYPFLRAHQRVHELFVRRVREFQEKFQQGEDIARQLHTVLKTWLVNHIKHDDADYAEIVRRHTGTDTEHKSGILGRLFGH